MAPFVRRWWATAGLVAALLVGPLAGVPRAQQLATPAAEAPASPGAESATPTPEPAKPAQTTPVPPGKSWRLDDFTKTYPPREIYGDWGVRKFKPLFGNGDQFFFQFVHSEKEHVIVLKSGSDNSFSVGITGKTFRVQDWPVWEWEWKMVKLPKGGDVRVKDRDDQAGSVCLIVNPGLTGFKSLCYLFENDGPKEKGITSQQREDSKYFILRTAKAGDPVGTWLKERRNVLQDYQRLFGKAPDEVAVFGFQIDSNDTKSSAEAHYRNVYLRKP